MKAVTISPNGPVVQDHPDPEAGAGELLVRVRGAGLNSADLLQLRGVYPAPPGSPPDILGLELAGEVEAVGPGTTRFAVGDRVTAVVGGGAQAELCVVHERCAMAMPDGLSWAEAGGFAEIYSTAHDAVFSQAELKMGERLLVTGAAGGVGTAAVQLGAAAGATVVASVRNRDNWNAVRQLGAAEVVAPDEERDHGPYDVILELVGAPGFTDRLDALNTGGRVAVIGVGAGSGVEMNLLVLMSKRARIHGSTLRARPLEAKADVARRVEAHVMPLVGRPLRVLVDTAVPLIEAPAAYERFAAGGKLGKIVLTT